MVGMAFNPAFYSACLYSRLFPNDFFPEQADQGLSYSFTEGIHTPTEKLAIVSNLIQKGTLLDHNHNKAAIQELFIHIIDELFHMDDKLSRQLANVQPIKAATRKELMRKLKIAIDYMVACPQEIPDIASVANAATLSEFHFYRLFKKAFKISPYQYLQRNRLSLAARLLKSSSLPVLDVCYAAGFNDHSSFSRLFRKSYHCTPREFRQGR